MKRFIFPLVVVGFFLGFANPARAQQPISEAKRKLIGEIAALTETSTQMRSMIDMFSGVEEKAYVSELEASINKIEGLSAAEKSAFIEKAKASYVRASQKISKRIKEEIDFDAFINDSIYALYDKHFTESELRDIVAFYSTPTGKKTIKEMPSLFADSVKVTQEKLLPAVMKIAGEVIEEERKLLAAETGPEK